MHNWVLDRVILKSDGAYSSKYATRYICSQCDIIRYEIDYQFNYFEIKNEQGMAKYISCNHRIMEQILK